MKNMNKKILLACLILVAVIASIGAVSAYYDLNIPDGFEPPHPIGDEDS